VSGTADSRATCGECRERPKVARDLLVVLYARRVHTGTTEFLRPEGHEITIRDTVVHDCVAREGHR